MKFPVVAAGAFPDAEACLHTEALAASVVIWTTTPWTIPQNRAVAYSPEIAYGLYRVEAVADCGTASAWLASNSDVNAFIRK